MSIDMDYMAGEEFITAEELGQELAAFFGLSAGDTVPERVSEQVVVFGGVFEPVGFLVFHIVRKGGMYPGVYESAILKRDFPYEQSVSFRLDKERDIPETLNVVLRFVCHLFRKYPVNALLEVLDRDECLFEKESGKIYLRPGSDCISPETLRACGIEALRAGAGKH